MQLNLIQGHTNPENYATVTPKFVTSKHKELLPPPQDQ
jgi:hypothetical protein